MGGEESYVEIKKRLRQKFIKIFPKIQKLFMICAGVRGYELEGYAELSSWPEQSNQPSLLSLPAVNHKQLRSTFPGTTSSPTLEKSASDATMIIRAVSPQITGNQAGQLLVPQWRFTKCPWQTSLCQADGRKLPYNLLLSLLLLSQAPPWPLGKPAI